MSMKDITHRYYEAWAARDQERVREVLHAELVFTNPQDSFDAADSFLSACWRYSTGLAGVRFVKDVCEEDRVFVILQWLNEDGSTFADAEYLEFSNGKMKEIVVFNNGPLFEKLFGKSALTTPEYPQPFLV